MIATQVIEALQLPRSTRVEQRIPKKLLTEHGAATPADKRRIADGIEELSWVAALKPHTIGVPIYRDDEREYLEVAVLSLLLRTESDGARLVELIHRAIPYPVLLVTAGDQALRLSAAHKRWAQNEAGKMVLDGGVTEAALPETDWPPLAVAAQPKANLYALYQGWLAAIEALLAARLTGQVMLAGDEQAIEARRVALGEHQRLTQAIDKLRAQAKREGQMARRVEFNLELQRLTAALAEATKQL